MNCILLGAGASKSYADSPTTVKMPIAKDFFSTFFQLKISENPWVMYNHIIHFLRNYKKTDIEYLLQGDVDIEAFHSEIEEAYLEAYKKNDQMQTVLYFGAYNQLIFLFAAVLNSIQNGPTSKSHLNIAKLLSPDDVIITFNWDTLMDKALEVHTNWKPDYGYSFQPRKIYNDAWVNPISLKSTDFPLLLKLHGSTNWITTNTTYENGKIELMHDEPSDTVYLYHKSTFPYPTYRGRYMDNYEPFSYGYYPPNILDSAGKQAPDGQIFVHNYLNIPEIPKGTSSDDGIISMPLIIPPVKNKSYDLFGSLFKNLWNTAEEKITESDNIIIIGYSFPITDYQSNELFMKAFLKKNKLPKITIIDPSPERIKDKFLHEFGIPESNITVVKEYFSETLDLSKFFV